MNEPTNARETDTTGPRSEHLIVVDDDRAFRIATRTLLEDEGYAVTVASNAEEALTAQRSKECDLLLSDMVMGKVSGLELLKQIRAIQPTLPVIMVTGFGSVETAVEAMRLGATDYLTKPVNNRELLIKVRRALDARLRERELIALREELHGTYSLGSMVTRSPLMKTVLKQIQQVTDTDVTVLVQGESGTGKELVAKALHYSSRRKDSPFVVANCSAIPENLMESELFGYEKGAFTGAVRQRAGKFEEANTGTLFLDEIGDIAPSVQTKLLRVLQEKTFERVGGNRPLTVDTRIIAATNRNLEVMVREGDFREDLYYRLNVFPIVLPPLRERPEDIPLLADRLIERYVDLSGGRVKHLAPSVLSDMMRYHWRGNVRELENLIKRAIIKTDGDTIQALELPHTEVPPPGGAYKEALTVSQTMPYKEYISTLLRHAEEQYILRMLQEHKGNINQIAKLMDVDRKTIYRKMADYGIDPTRFRS